MTFKKMIHILMMMTLLSGCGYHFSKNTGTQVGDGGFVGKLTEAETLEGDLKKWDEEVQRRFEKKFNSENVNATYEHPQYGEGVTLLMLAATLFEKKAPVRFLVELGGDPMALASSGHDAFGFAEREANKRLEQINSEREADGKPPVLIEDFELYQEMVKALTPRAPISEINMKLIEAIKEDKAELVEAAKNEGADLNHLTEEGITGLMVAVRDMKRRALRPLIRFAKEGELDLNIKSSEGEIVVEMAERLAEAATDKREKRTRGKILTEIKCAIDPSHNPRACR